MSTATWLWPHAAVLVCCVARLLPVAFLCPMLGGQIAPAPVKLAVVLALAGALHFAAGVGLPAPALDAWSLAAAALREAVLGTGVGLLASFPFDAVRTAGRWIDTFRGASAEAALPIAGSREAASGDLFHQLFVAIGTAGGVWGLFIRAVWQSFARIPLGRWGAAEAPALTVAGLLGEAMALAFALGAPVAAAALVLDGVLGALARIAPALRLHELSSAGRLFIGGALLCAGLSVLAGRMMFALSRLPQAIQALLGGAG